MERKKSSPLSFASQILDLCGKLGRQLLKLSVQDVTNASTLLNQVVVQNLLDDGLAQQNASGITNPTITLLTFSIDAPLLQRLTC